MYKKGACLTANSFFEIKLFGSLHSLHIISGSCPDVVGIWILAQLDSTFDDDRNADYVCCNSDKCHNSLSGGVCGDSEGFHSLAGCCGLAQTCAVEFNSFVIQIDGCKIFASSAVYRRQNGELSL